MPLSTYHKQLMHHVAREKGHFVITCEDAREVYALSAALNRWRKDYVAGQKKLVENMPEAALSLDIEQVRVRKRFDPPRLVLEYDDMLDRPLYDSEGNYICTPRDLENQEYERLRQELAAWRGEEAAPSEDEKERYRRQLEQQLGVDLEDDLDIDI